jgi:hypothetical protein
MTKINAEKNGLIGWGGVIPWSWGIVQRRLLVKREGLYFADTGKVA